MRTRLLPLVFLCLSVGCAPTHRGLVIAHRGASGYLSEHTLPAYALAYGLGADVIEPDVVLTRDAVPVCSHDVTVHNPLAVRLLNAGFPGRQRPDGKLYLIDFDLAELRSIAAPLGRTNGPASGTRLVTLDEMIELVKHLNAETGRHVQIAPEAKAPAFHRDSGSPIEPVLLATLARHGYSARGDGAIIQCFDLDALRRMRTELGTDLRLVYLVSEPVSDSVLDDLASFADGIGPSRKLIENDDGSPGKQPDIADRAASRGLAVYVWTFDRDAARTRRFNTMTSVTGVFTDFPERH